MKLGLVMCDLSGGDYSYTFVDEERWQAICAIEEEDERPWNDATLTLIDSDNRDAPGRIIRECYAQCGVFEELRLAGTIIGIVSVRCL